MTTDSLQIPQLLAPAGNWECALAAVENGADRSTLVWISSTLECERKISPKQIYRS